MKSAVLGAGHIAIEANEKAHSISLGDSLNSDWSAQNSVRVNDPSSIYNLVGDASVSSLRHTHTNAEDPNKDPNGPAHFSQDYQTWLNYGGFYINIYNSANLTASATWTTANPGGSGGSGGTQPQASTEAAPTSPEMHASLELASCSLAFAAAILAAPTPFELPAYLTAAGACAGLLGSDWDNFSEGISQLSQAVAGYASGNDAAGSSSFADFANSLGGSPAASTGSELIYSPDGLVYKGNDTGGWGNTDSFSSNTGAPPIIIRYDDLPFAMHH